jgi:hypothetical protein
MCLKIWQPLVDVFKGNIGYQPLGSTILGDFQTNTSTIYLDVARNDFDQLVAQCFHCSRRERTPIVDQNQAQPLLGSFSAFVSPAK